MIFKIKFFSPAFTTVSVGRFFLIFFFPAFSAFSQSDIGTHLDTSGVHKLSDIVVTATRTNTSTLELANSITVIDSAEIHNRNANTVADLLKTEYGLGLTSFGSFGSLKTLNIRGANAGHTLVLIDGVEMNMPSDNQVIYDFGVLPVESIDKIEILRGPESTLYGSDAVAGVVNITTKKGVGEGNFEISAQGGSYSTYLLNSTFSGSLSQLNYLLSYSRKNTDGFSSAGEKYGNTEKDGSTTNNFISRIGYNVLNNLDLNFFLRFNKADNDLDQFGGEFGDDPTYEYTMDELTARLEAGFSLLDGLWDLRIGGSYLKNIRDYNYDSTFYNASSSKSNYEGRKIKFDWQNNIYLYERSSESNIITSGIEIEQEEVATEFYSFSSQFGNYASIVPRTQVTTGGLYLQDQIKLWGNFFSSIGLRFDNHEKFGSAITYRIAPAYIFWQTGTKVKATIGTGIKAPSVFYLYDPVYGNENLNPEKSFGWDIGFEQFFWSQGITFGATYFSNELRDMIALDENFKSINIAKAETKGVEVFLTAKFIPAVTVKANYTFLDTQDKSESSADFNQPLLRRPDHKIGLLINLIPVERLNINLETIYVGKKDDKIFLPDFTSMRIKLDDYTLLNISSHYDLFDFLRIFIRAENLFDTEYEENYGYGTPGLSAYAGVKVIIN